LIPALESAEMGASENRFEVKCFLSALAKFELIMMLVLGAAMVLIAGEGRTRA